MLVIRYFRIGKKNQPYFKIVVTDKRRPTRGGRFVEEVGFSDPVKKKRTLKADRIKYWISKGAQPSDSIHNLLISEKIIEGKKIPVHKKAKAKEGQAKPVVLAAEQKPVIKDKIADLPAEDQGVQEGTPVKEEVKPEETPIVKEKKIEAPAGLSADAKEVKEEEQRIEAPGEEAK